MHKGVFISFEGSEGCGKSTQIERLARHLRAIGYRVRSRLTDSPPSRPGPPSTSRVLGMVQGNTIRTGNEIIAP